MISPADLQGILGMMAHDQRTGFRGFPRLPTGLFGSRGGRRSGGRQVCSQNTTWLQQGFFGLKLVDLWHLLRVFFGLSHILRQSNAQILD